MINNGVVPAILSRNVYQVHSQSSDKVYKVISNIEHSGSGWTCECPDHTFKGMECKHIHAIKFWLALKEKLTIQKQEAELRVQSGY